MADAQTSEGKTGRAVVEALGPDTRAELALYIAHGFFPQRDADGGFKFETSDLSKRNTDWLRQYDPRARIEGITHQDLLAHIENTFGALLADDAANRLAHRLPRLSAHFTASHDQISAMLFIGVALAGLAVCFPDLAFLGLVTITSFGFVAGIAFRALLSLAGGHMEASAEPRIATDELPLYTILVPLYREANVLPRLARSLLRLDYPHDKLQILLIVEADDPETIAVALDMTARGPFEVIRVPKGEPRTKPRACNYALNFARGEFTVIYDAEDRPELDQLVKAVNAFRRLPSTVACLQARLTFYNANNWLTRLFKVDYLMWFWSLLPGLDRLEVPTPLGGTSNHFPTEILRRLGGWDPFNVTEDADLGIRMVQLGKRATMLDSTTFEEAPEKLGAWLKQRSRWIKGYMQTWLVHTRDPVGLWRRAGFKGFIAFHLFIGGSVLSALLNPLLWLISLLSLLFGWHVLGPEAGQRVLLFSGAALIVGHTILTGIAIAATVRQGWHGLAPYGFLIIVYWAFISVAAYRALHQLIMNPHYWDKTDHGVASPRQRA